MKIPVSNPCISESDATSVFEVVKSGWAQPLFTTSKTEVASDSEMQGFETGIFI